MSIDPDALEHAKATWPSWYHSPTFNQVWGYRQIEIDSLIKDRDSLFEKYRQEKIDRLSLQARKADLMTKLEDMTTQRDSLLKQLEQNKPL